LEIQYPFALVCERLRYGAYGIVIKAFDRGRRAYMRERRMRATFHGAAKKCRRIEGDFSQNGKGHLIVFMLREPVADGMTLQPRFGLACLHLFQDVAQCFAVGLDCVV
jgi:hypothetical protein